MSEMIILGLAGLAIIILFRALRVVPQQKAFVVERLGKYDRTLVAGMHFIIPFMDSIRYIHQLKENVLDIPPQICITKDNVQVSVDGVLFYRVMDAHKASYGVNDYEQAIVQLAQTTLRSEIGKIDLDKTFEEREKMNNAVILAIDYATDPWGVKVLRYEIKSIQPPKDVLDAMEKQMRAEREKRAKILESEADRDSKINRAEGQKQEVIKHSEAEKLKKINEAEGQASAILAIAEATANGLKKMAVSMEAPGGMEAAQLRVAEEYVRQFGRLAEDAQTVIVPANVNDASSMIATAYSVFNKVRANDHKGGKSPTL